MEHPFFQNGFLILGHRGVPGEAPENTLSSFRLAKMQGADGIELDIRQCKSGELIVIHDARLNRTTSGRGFVRAKTLQQLKGLHITGADQQERIPTLEEVFREFIDEMILNVEIKGHPRKADGVEQKLIALIRRYNAVDRVIVSSFNPIPLRRIRKLAPEIATAFLVDRKFFVHRSEKAIVKLAGIHAIHLEAHLAAPPLVKRLREMGLHVLLWGEFPFERIPELRTMPLDGIITDYPKQVRQILEGLQP